MFKIYHYIANTCDKKEYTIDNIMNYLIIDNIDFPDIELEYNMNSKYITDNTYQYTNVYELDNISTGNKFVNFCRVDVNFIDINGNNDISTRYFNEIDDNDLDSLYFLINIPCISRIEIFVYYFKIIGLDIFSDDISNMDNIFC